MEIKTTSNRLNKYLPYFYLTLSIYIFVQATFFPQQPANILINFLNPKLDSGASVFSISDYVRYLTIVVYAGLAISGALFFIAIDNLLSRRVKSARLFNVVHVIITLSNSILGFLCGVKVYHLFHGDNPGFFSISGQTLITLIVFFICILFYSIRKKKLSRPLDPLGL